MITLSDFRLAARRTDVSTSGIRAGEGKTGWTNPLPLAPGLWMLNAGGLLVGLRLGRSELGLGPVRGARRALDQSARPGVGHFAPAPARRWPSRRECSHPGPAGA